MCLFDLCPDIEGLIQDELDVLLKFREATKEFKLRLKLNERSMKKFKQRYSVITPGHGWRFRKPVNIGEMIMDCLYPCISKHPICREKRGANIHGFYWTSNYRLGVSLGDWTCQNLTHQDLNDKLTELGYTRFKSKKKPDKIKLLLKHTNEWYKR